MLEFLRRDAGGSNDLSEASSQLLIVIKEGCRNDGAVARGAGGGFRCCVRRQ